MCVYLHTYVCVHVLCMVSYSTVVLYGRDQYEIIT